MTTLSPAALAVWEAFNEDEAGVFVDYGDKLAAALRAAADQVVPDEPHPEESQFWDEEGNQEWQNDQHFRLQLLAIADELDGATTTSENVLNG